MRKNKKQKKIKELGELLKLLNLKQGRYKMKYFRIFLGWGMFLILSLTAFANDIPQLMNFQGILTDGSDNPIRNQTKDVEFKIYDADVAGNVKWSETQSITTDNNGAFNVLLGSSNAIPDTAFRGFPRWLGIKIVGEASEMTPRQKLASVPYSYEFDNKGPDSTISSVVGASFSARNSLSSASPVQGVLGIGDNPGAGNAYGGYFKTTASGTGNHYGLYSEANATSGTASSYGLLAVNNATTATIHYGVVGQAFSAGVQNRGVYGSANFATGLNIGVFGSASGSGAIGARFVASGTEGTIYGIHDSANGSLGVGTTYGIYSVAANPDAGEIIGGEFKIALGGGSVNRLGLVADVAGPSSAVAKGVVGRVDNSGAADNMGGHFIVTASGTGAHLGVFATSFASSISPSYGVKAIGDNSSTGPAYGGHFFGGGGTLTSYGVYGDAANGVGVFGTASGAGAYAGRFEDAKVRVGNLGTESFVNGDGDLYVEDELEVDGGLSIGQGGAQILKVLTATDVLDFPSTAAQTSSSLTITVTGAAVGDAVFLGDPASYPVNTAFTARVGSANVVTIRFHNYDNVANDPASGTFRVAVMKF